MNLQLRALSLGLLLSTALFGRGQETSPLLGNKKLSLDDPVPAEPAPAKPADPAPSPETVPASEDGFSFDKVKSLASSRAQRPYVDRKSDLPSFWKDLRFTDYQKIHNVADQAFWKAENVGYSLAFIHPGATYEKAIHLSEVKEGRSNEIEWLSKHFDYSGLTIPEGTPPPSGYAGFKIQFPLNAPDSSDELAMFDGASMFRCTAPGLNFGVTARGVVLNTAQTEGEEFPSFERFWMERPSTSTKPVNFFSLLDSPSVAGAYRFRLTPGRSTVMEVEAELTFRQDLPVIGFAPLSSMFWFSELTHPRPADYRDEVHNSDGLLIHVADGEAIWRPLDNGTTMRHAVYQTEKFIGFGLVQRDRDFKSYQDIDSAFQNRTTAYIEPVGKWPAGKIHLIELPTTDSHWDNVVAFWEPDVHPKPGQPFHIGYRIHWLGDMGVPGLSKVTGSRRSQTAYTPEEKRPNTTRVVVDFAQLASLEDEKNEIIAAVEVGPGGKLLEKSIQKNPETGGWRTTFLVQIGEKTETMDLGCRLISNGRPVSERWNYQWKK